MQWNKKFNFAIPTCIVNKRKHKIRSRSLIVYLRQNLHENDQVKLTHTTEINELHVTFNEIDAFCGNYPGS